MVGDGDAILSAYVAECRAIAGNIASFTGPILWPAVVTACMQTNFVYATYIPINSTHDEYLEILHAQQ